MPYNSDPASGQTSSVYSFPDPKPNQHLRLTLNEVIDQYQKKLIKATTLVYYAVKIYRQDGQKLRVKDVNAFCQRLGINRSTFYKAVNNLEEANVGFRSAPSDGATLWIEESPLGNTESPLGNTESPLGNTESPLGNTESPLGNTESPLGDTESPLGDTESSLGDTESPLGENELSKPAPDKASSPSSNTYHIFIISLSNSERESFLKFAREKANELPKTPTLLDKWIEKNWVELRDKWKPTHVSSSSSSKKEFCVADWKEHPQFKEWVREADNRYMWFINRCDCPLTKQERQALVDWVRANPGEVVS